MITAQARRRAAAALHALDAATPRASSLPGVAPAAGPARALSVVKALSLLGDRPRDPDAIHAEVIARLDVDTGVWPDPATGAASVLATAAGLLCLRGLDATASLDRWLRPGLRQIAELAHTREEHFMTIAVVDECGLGLKLPRSVDFFAAQQAADGTFGPSPLQNGIAASALLRAGETLADPGAVAALLLAAQTPDGGFADSDGGAELWTTYCVMRALDLLGVEPDGARLAQWTAARLDTTPFSADTAYQCLSVLDWVAAPQFAEIRRGDVAAVTRRLAAGGDPDARDLQGWTPLAVAAVRGQAAVSRALLATGADPTLRTPDADAPPIFWAGQSGDLDTARALLERRPDQLYATSSVNGHTVLLQAVFFGAQRHRDLAAALIAQVGEILGLPADDAEAIGRARRRLLAACNVRGYTATAMAKLWHNTAMTALLADVDDTTAAERDDYRVALLASIALPEPDDPGERAAQWVTDELIATIGAGFDALNATAALPAAHDRPGDLEAALASVEAQLVAAVTAAVETPGFDVDRRGGPLAETPVIAAVTGVDADERVAAARLRLTQLLLRHGADPDLPELHPMGVDAVIRAAVLNHFACLRAIAEFMGPLAFAAALNERPAINGQTALDDTVHRALTASDDTVQSHLDQIRWVIGRGARVDVPDLTGVTVADRARLALHDDVLAARAPAVLAALGLA